GSAPRRGAAELRAGARRAARGDGAARTGAHAHPPAAPARGGLRGRAREGRRRAARRTHQRAADRARRGGGRQRPLRRAADGHHQPVGAPRRAQVTSIAAWIVGAALVVAGAAHLWTRRTRGARADAIQLVATRYLGAKRFLAIVEVDG